MASVLIADDTMFMRCMIKRLLMTHGFEIVGEASNGMEAINMYKKLKPDIVTMDITMPEKNGIEAVKEIKEYDSKARIIMVTSLGQESMVKESIINGAQGFIIKPFKEDVLIDAIKKLI